MDKNNASNANNDIKIVSEASKDENTSNSADMTAMKANILNKDAWLHILWIFAYSMANYFVLMFAIAISGVQILFLLFTGSTNANIKKLHMSIFNFMVDSLKFILLLSEEKPFPFKSAD